MKGGGIEGLRMTWGQERGTRSRGEVETSPNYAMVSTKVIDGWESSHVPPQKGKRKGKEQKVIEELRGGWGRSE